MATRIIKLKRKNNAGVEAFRHIDCTGTYSHLKISRPAPDVLAQSVLSLGVGFVAVPGWLGLQD